MQAYDELCDPTEEERDYDERFPHEPSPAISPLDFEFSLADEPFVVNLSVRSRRTQEWNTYFLNDEFCSCPAGSHGRLCYHRKFILQDCGGYAAVIKACLDKLRAQPKGA